MTWRDRARAAINYIDAGLAADATLDERKRALAKAAGDFHCNASWLRQVWYEERRKYLARFGATIDRGRQCPKLAAAVEGWRHYISVQRGRPTMRSDTRECVERRAYYARTYRSPLKHEANQRVVPPEDVEVREFSGPCWRCGSSGPCQHRRSSFESVSY